MFAVIRTGGKQYKVKEGDVLEVERLEAEKDQKVTFKDILLVDDEKTTWIGNPALDNTRVQAVVLDNFKDEKIIIFKKKRRKQYKRTLGHRQALTRVKIEKIVVGKEAIAKPKPAEEEAKPAPKAKASATKPAVSKKAPPKKVGPSAVKPKPGTKAKPDKAAAKKTAEKMAREAKAVPKSEKTESAPTIKKAKPKAARTKTKTKES